MKVASRKPWTRVSRISRWSKPAFAPTLGVSFMALGEWEVASEQFLRTRALYAANLGPDDPETLRSMNNLATSYVYRGRVTEGLDLYQETLALRKVKLGPAHVETLRTMNFLANCYDELHRYDEALKLHNETLALWTAHFGPEHAGRRSTDMTLHLANSYAGLGR